MLEKKLEEITVMQWNIERTARVLSLPPPSALSTKRPSSQSPPSCLIFRLPTHPRAYAPGETVLVARYFISKN